MNYYNEYDKDAAAWLRQLIRDMVIPEGVVDERSIAEVRPKDLEGFAQCHFFAGLGGWAYALSLAGVPDDFPLWTGSCPCQSFSVAGKKLGFDDPRGKLWLEFKRLIAARRPALVFGEQVDGAIDHGWLDLVASDLGDAGYSFGSAVFPAVHVGAAHKRPRIYFVGDADGESGTPRLRPFGSDLDFAALGLEGFDFDKGFWSDAAEVECADGQRRLLPKLDAQGLSLLVDDGLSRPLVLLRGAGNAIVPQQAAEFVSAFFEAKGQMSRKPKAKAAGAGR
jgi:DNA (cytosine-5)-methyltransferase 1